MKQIESIIKVEKETKESTQWYNMYLMTVTLC